MGVRGYLTLLSLFAFVAACGSPEHIDSDTGSLAFSVKWEDAPTLSPGVKQGPSFAPLDCVGAGVSTVSAFAYSAADALLASGGPWNCSDHSGTISNITPQSNIKIVVLAKDSSNNVLYRGEQPGITVTAGQVTSAGTITATYFPPVLTAPTNGATVIQGNFDLTWTSTAATYQIQVSDDIGFTSTMVDTPVNATLHNPTSLSAGTYYWRVRSFDSYGNSSVWSAIGNFSVASSSKAITAFWFTSPPTTGTINESAKTISVTVPYGTNVSALVASFSTTGANVSVGSTVQVSGTTPNNFVIPVMYVVTASDGTSATYTVSVTIAPSSAKAITSFLFTSLSATGTINESARTISVTVPYGTDLTALVASFAATGVNVTVGSTVQVSGTTPNDFTNPVFYVVTAADSTTATYTVTVTPAAKELYVLNNLGETVCALNSQMTGSINYLRKFGNNTGLNASYNVALDSTNDEILVANRSTNSITAYGRTARGNVAPIRIISDTSTGMSNLRGIAVDTMNNEIFVLTDSSIRIYNRTANGNVAPLRTITGASTGLQGAAAIAVDAVNDEIFVTNYSGPSSITVYSRTANGNVAPLRTISGASTLLSQVSGVAVDTVNNEILVSNEYGGLSLVVYSRTANGNISPLRSISGSSTQMSAPLNIAIDTVHNEYVVPNNMNDSITVYSRTANGNVAPLRTISGASTGLDYPTGVAIDTLNNEIIISNFNPAAISGSVTVYSRTLNGDSAPSRTISGASSGIINPSGLAVDSVNNEIHVGNRSNPNAITVYNRSASGTVTPVRAISGASTGLSGLGGIAVDTANNEIYAVNATARSVTVYGRTASGNVTPVRTISGVSTGFSQPWAIVVDTVNDAIYVSDTGNNSIRVFGRTANGDISPFQTIQGANTGLSGPRHIAIDMVNNEIIVANRNSGTITVYSRTANGNVAPVRTIQGASTGLSSPRGVAVDTERNEIFVANYDSNTVTTYSRTANGNVAPLRIISGSTTGISRPEHIALQ